MRLLLTLHLSLFCITLNAGPVFAAGVEAKLSHFGETLHFELRGKDQWVYKVDRSTAKDKTIYTVQVPDLDSASISALKSAQFPGLESVQVEAGPDQSQNVKLTFKSTKVDHFDYLTDKPSRLIVDFFAKSDESEKAKSPTSKKSEKSVSVASELPAKIDPKASKTGRTPANDRLTINPQGPLEELGMGTSVGATVIGPQPQQQQTGIFDGADPDFSRFQIQDFEVKEEAIIASRQKVYVDFPILHVKPDELEIMQAKAPVYQIDAKENEENQQARLLLTLSKNKRTNVFLKTADWFFKQYPDSEYAEILKFLWADVLYGQWIESRKSEDLDVALAKYEEAMKQFPKSALLERTLLLSAYSKLERGDYLSSLQALGAYNTRFPSSPNKDLVKMAMAEAYLQLNRADDAMKIYNDVIATAVRPQDKIRAAFLRPDLLFNGKKDAEAIDAYKKVMAQYPKEASDFPNAAFNMAAAQFRQGNFRQSLQDHLDFVKQFPTHYYSGYALTRVGELLEILGADPARVNGAFLETYFRYGSTPGAVVARLRLVSSRMKAMKPQELEKAVKDIMKLAADSNLPKMEQFATVMVADGYHNRGDFEKSTDLLVKFYQKEPTNTETGLLTQRIVRNIADEIHNEVEAQNFIKALNTHQKYSSSWLRNHQRVDIQYDLARAFEQAGVLGESEKLYRESLNRILALKGTRGEKEIGIFEKVPSKDEILLRLAAVNLNRENSQQAFDNLKAIENPAKFTQEQQIERVLLASKIYDQKGEPETAVRYLMELVNAWKGIPSLVSEPYFHLGQMEEKLGHNEAAINSYRRVDELMNDSGKVAERTHFKALENMARLQMETKKPEDAIKTYERLLGLYEPKFSIASHRYRLGKIHFDRGEMQKAAETWDKLDKTKSSFWAKLADENLKSSKWGDDYKKYLQRIPAMADSRKEKP